MVTKTDQALALRRLRRCRARPMVPNRQGRLDLSPVGLLIGLEGDRCRLYDGRTGERLPDYEERVQAMKAAEAKARDAAEHIAGPEARLHELEEGLHRRGGQD